jgi:hypothetical protein
MSITTEELAALKSLRGKLIPLKVPEWTVVTKSGAAPLYAPFIRQAIARGNLQEMKALAVSTREWVVEVKSALDQLESSVKRAGG